MQLTDFHATYFAYELTKRCASDSVEKLVPVLADAQVDLNPHQVEAALFAFRSPFSKGAILADEVGLGKTIEAGLLLAQKWAERKRRLLVIVPANLRKQWGQKLTDKFYLPSIILETRSFNEAIRAGNLNPFQQDAVILCSYQFARNKEPYLLQTPWDLVVIDEAHRLRNVYKTSSKIALAIKQAVAPFPKVLLTATPLQTNPFPSENIHPGPYRMAKGVEDVNTYRVGHPLAQHVLERGKSLTPPSAEVTFQYTGSSKNIAILEPLVGQRGWLVCSPLTMSTLETEDLLVLAGCNDDGTLLDEPQCRRLFDLPAIQSARCAMPAPTAAALDDVQARRRQELLDETTSRNSHWFDTEMDKLDCWAEDRRTSLKAELAALDEALKEAKKAARLAPTLPEKLERQRAARSLEGKREEAWRAYDHASRNIDRQKDALLDEMSQRLEQHIEQAQLFALRWQLA